MSYIPKSNTKHHKGGHHEGTKDTKIFEPQRRKERKVFFVKTLQGLDAKIEHHKGGHHEGTKDTKIFEPQRRKERKGF